MTTQNSSKYRLASIATRISDKYADVLTGFEPPTRTDEAVRIILLGEFNAGKSSLTNALLGRDILPVDIFQTTATINRVRPGANEGFKVFGHDDQVIDEGRSIQELHRFSADYGSFEEIKWIDVFWPALPENIELIDTPGFNDPNPVRDRTFVSMVPYADMIIFVCDANQAMKGSELPYIQKYFLNSLMRSYFVFNHSDTLQTIGRLEDVRKSVEKHLVEMVKNAAILYDRNGLKDLCAQLESIRIAEHIFFVSASLASGKDNVQCIDSTLAESLTKSFSCLHERVTKSASLKASIREEWEIERILDYANERLSFLHSLDSTESDSSQKQSAQLVALLERVEKQHAAYKDIKNRITGLPDTVAKSLNTNLPKSIGQIETVVRSFGDDFGAAYASEMYQREFLAVVQRTIEEVKSLISKELEHPLEVSISTTKDSLDLSQLGSLTNYHRQQDLSTKYAQAGVASAIAFGIGAILFGYLGGIIASAAFGGAVQINAIEGQKRDINKAYEKILEHANSTLRSIHFEIIESIRKSLVSFESEVLKGADNLQWQLIEYCDFFSDERKASRDDLVQQCEKVKLCIKECTSQLFALRGASW